MINIRKSKDRGHANHGWLDSFHSFSFANYYDPKHMSFRCLRVINEDRINQGGGFPSHPHSDMEIITYVIKGDLAHKDSMGNIESLIPGEVQVMSAGTGVVHSEFNNSRGETHLLQIWIVPDKRDYQPRYQQKSFSKEIKSQDLTLVVSPDGADGSISIRQNMKLFVGSIKNEQEINYPLEKNRYAWIQVIKGELDLSHFSLSEGDGAAIGMENILKIKCISDCEFLLFDLP